MKLFSKLGHVGNFGAILGTFGTIWGTIVAVFGIFGKLCGTSVYTGLNAFVYTGLGKLSSKKNGKKSRHCLHVGEGGQPQFIN